jgi:hypothetical protein
MDPSGQVMEYIQAYFCMQGEALLSKFAQLSAAVTAAQVEGAYNGTVTLIRDLNKPALQAFGADQGGFGVVRANHAVVAYKIIDLGKDEKRVYVYDNNSPWQTHEYGPYPGFNKALDYSTNEYLLYGNGYAVCVAASPTGAAVTFPYGLAYAPLLDLFATYPCAQGVDNDMSGIICTGAWDSPYAWVEILICCEVETFATDSEGRCCGVIDGRVVNDIPGAHYFEIDGAHILILSSLVNHDVHVKGLADGTMTATYRVCREDGSSLTSEFVDVPISDHYEAVSTIGRAIDDVQLHESDAFGTRTRQPDVQEVVRPAENGVSRVPEDYPSIQAAVDAASDGMTVLVAPGTYRGNVDFKGKGIVLRSRSGASRTFLTSGSKGSGVVFSSAGGRNSMLNGFTIKSGLATNGGGIYINGASPTIMNCHITENVAGDGSAGGYGGGIYISGGSPFLFNNLITNNTAVAESGGGGIYACNGARPIIRNCTITSDHANFAPGGVRIATGASAEISDTILWSNSPQDFLDDDGTASVNNSDLGCAGAAGQSNISQDPLFSPGTLGNYYLAAQSPCLDIGSDLVSNVGDLGLRTTSASGVADTGQADIGYHYEKHPIWIQKVWTGDARGGRKDGFLPGETMTYNVRYTIEEPQGATYVASGTVKRGNQTGCKSQEQSAGTYVMHIKKKAPTKSGKKKATISMEVKDSSGVLLGTDETALTFRVR